MSVELSDEEFERANKAGAVIRKPLKEQISERKKNKPAVKPKETNDLKAAQEITAAAIETTRQVVAITEQSAQSSSLHHQNTNDLIKTLSEQVNKAKPTRMIVNRNTDPKSKNYQLIESVDFIPIRIKK